MTGEKALACAVILQWMEDFQEAYYRKVRRYFLNAEHRNTLNWLDTEWADFWCEVAEIDKYWLKEWAEKIKQEIKNQIKGEGKWLKKQYTTQKSNSLNLSLVLNLPRRAF